MQILNSNIFELDTFYLVIIKELIESTKDIKLINILDYWNRHKDLYIRLYENYCYMYYFYILDQIEYNKNSYYFPFKDYFKFYIGKIDPIIEHILLSYNIGIKNGNLYLSNFYYSKIKDLLSEKCKDKIIDLNVVNEYD